MRILYVSSEVDPFLNTSKIAEFIRKLPSAMQDKGLEIRILVPRFGVINERKNRLHEVVRLSGSTIPVGEEDKPLTIKVASIPSAKLQVYFIDNEDLFLRKNTLNDKDGKFLADNHERAFFFCKGALETVIKLGWAPDIIHCNDWISALVPLYIEKHFKTNPVLKDVKTVFTPHNTYFEHTFKDEELLEKARLGDISDEDLALLSPGNYEAFLKIGAQYANKIITLDTANDVAKSIADEFQTKTHANISENDIDFFEKFYLELGES